MGRRCGLPGNCSRTGSRVLGADHPDVLTSRSNIAVWTGECGNRAEALRLAWELQSDQVRVLGGITPGSWPPQQHRGPGGR